ncbi:MAG: tRNA (adenosine(37)-N6)-dimethylallyltransferase MiaA [Saprospiraceae bacterium]|nr:tRNA (adenosine(37)-N6)-dimethylallyltransferase MiaA [Saprospiraceae bacterium]
MKVDLPLLVVIGGPTGIGKTEAAIRVASKYSTEIVSADSRQVYMELNIGVARPDEDQLNAVPHHLIAHRSIKDEYSAGHYEEEALSVLDKLFEKHDRVIASGGTGLYLKALTEGLDKFPKVSRQKWTSVFNSEGLSFLQEALRELDPDYYRSVDIQNPHRLIRALSVIEETGLPFSSFLGRSENTRPFNTIKLALTRDRDELYERINQRVDEMMSEGLLDEVRRLLPYRHLSALQTVGYQELFEYLDGLYTLNEAVEKIKQHTRNYAKRQMTWFRNQGEWTKVHPENVLEYVYQLTEKKNE